MCTCEAAMQVQIMCHKYTQCHFFCPKESTSGSVTTFATETNIDSTFGSEDGFDLPEKDNLNELLLREAQVGKGCGEWVRGVGRSGAR